MADMRTTDTDNTFTIVAVIIAVIIIGLVAYVAINQMRATSPDTGLPAGADSSIYTNGSADTDYSSAAAKTSLGGDAYSSADSGVWSSLSASAGLDSSL